MHKSLEQVEYYQAHYCSIYLKAKTKGKKVLRRHLEKVNERIRQLQRISPTAGCK